MKQLIFISLLIFLVGHSYAQDYLYKTNGEKIAVKIIKNDGKSLFYRVLGSRNQDLKTIPVEDVYMVDFERSGIQYSGDLKENLLINQDDGDDNDPGMAPGSSSQETDIINLNDGSRLEGIIAEVDERFVHYYPEGSDNSQKKIPVKEVWNVVYMDGRMQTLSNPEKDISHQQQGRNDVATSSFPESDGTEELNPFDSYFGAGLGYGNSYGGAGINARYIIEGSVKMSVNAGIGFYADELSADADRVLGYSAGVSFYFWEDLYLNAQYGGFGIFRYPEVNTSTNLISYELKPLTGLSGLLGYDLFINQKIGLNAGAGICYDLNADNNIFFALDAGLYILF